MGPDLTDNGGDDAFVAKVDPDGTGLAYAGFIGGPAATGANGIAVDAAGAAYVAGAPRPVQPTFPEAVGPDLTLNGGGDSDAFVAKVAPGGASLAYAGFIGGTARQAFGIAVDATGAAYVTGFTNSSERPSRPRRPRPHVNGAATPSWPRSPPTGRAWPTPASSAAAAWTRALGIAVDAAGAAYVTGFTLSAADLPGRGRPRPHLTAAADAFVAKVAPTGPSSSTPASSAAPATTLAAASRWTAPGPPTSPGATTPPRPPSRPRLAPTRRTTATTTPSWPRSAPGRAAHADRGVGRRRRPPGSR